MGPWQVQMNALPQIVIFFRIGIGKGSVSDRREGFSPLDIKFSGEQSRIDIFNPKPGKCPQACPFPKISLFRH